MRRFRHFGFIALLMLAFVCVAHSQVIEFESGGLKYQTLTKDGLTIMFAYMPSKVREYSILQVAISNGSSEPVTVRPADFMIETQRGSIIQAVPADQVISQLIRNASSNDVIKLVTTYEMGLYGMGRIVSSNGYEKRRQAALGIVSSKNLKAAAAASAIAFVETELPPGGSTDGAVFYPTNNLTVGVATLRVYASNRAFEYEPVDTAARNDR